jgi:hypothetical protein
MYDTAMNKWMLGKFPDIAVQKDHEMLPHFFQGENGYINNLRRTIEDDIAGTAMDFDKEISELDDSKSGLRLSATLAGEVKIYDYAQKRDNGYVNQANEDVVEE